MDFGSGQYIIWRYIKYFINKYVRSFEWEMFREKNWKYKSHSFYVYSVHCTGYTYQRFVHFDFFLRRFCHHRFSLSLSFYFTHSVTATAFFFIPKCEKW